MQKELMYEDIQIGDTAIFSKTISEFDIYQFAELRVILTQCILMQNLRIQPFLKIELLMAF